MQICVQRGLSPRISMMAIRHCVLFAFFCGTVYCYLELIPERFEVAFAHPNHCVNVTAKVKRYGRNSPYYLFGQGVLTETWDNNVTVHVDTYEYLHNEYRLSFMTIHRKFCDLIHKDILMGSIVRGVGLTCPTYSGVIVFNNASLRFENFPYELPLTRGMANITALKSDTNTLMLWLKLYARVKQYKNKKP